MSLAGPTVSVLHLNAFRRRRKLAIHGMRISTPCMYEYFDRKYFSLVSDGSDSVLSPLKGKKTKVDKSVFCLPSLFRVQTLFSS